MRWRAPLSAALVALLPVASAVRELKTSSLNSCQEHNNFSASLFDVVFTPSNGVLAFDVQGTSSISGNVTIDLVVIAYGLHAYSTTLDPCQLGFQGLCPMTDSTINLNSTNNIPKDQVSSIPGKFCKHILERPCER
jgi:hypothetical protein